MEGYIGGHIDDLDFPGGGQAPSSVTVLLRDPPCTSYFRLPHDRVAEWYGGASGDKRGYYEVVRGPCRLVVEVAGGTPVERHACAAHTWSMMESVSRSSVPLVAVSLGPGGWGAAFGNLGSKMICFTNDLFSHFHASASLWNTKDFAKH